MLVKDIMTTHTVSVHYRTSFLDAAKTFLAYHLSGAPVINETGELLGILSEKDLMRAMYPTYHEVYTHPHLFFHDEEMEEATMSAKRKCVGDIMSKRLITATPDTHIFKVGGHMVATGVHRVPVIDTEKKLIGMVARGDVYRAMLQEKFNIFTFKQIPEHTEKLQTA
jgi:CBS domain-containing protein